ncbi:MAG: hypothetical protein WBE74_02320, partial [Terracidiphilus sp.]
MAHTKDETASKIRDGILRRFDSWCRRCGAYRWAAHQNEEPRILSEALSKRLMRYLSTVFGHHLSGNFNQLIIV